MENKNTTTKENLIKLLAKYIKECSKRLGDNHPSTEVSISFHNWYSGGNWKTRKWSNDEIKFNRETYKFYDKEIGDSGFVQIVEDALKMSGCKGKVKCNEWEETNPNGWMYSPIKHKSFESLTLIGKPCKEFKLLQSMVKKYSGKEIGECEIYSADVCGKRSSWSESGDVIYLDFDKRTCQKAIDFIRGKRTSKDSLDIQFGEKLSHGDEEDYRIAQYQESEWYGAFYKYMEINVFTPSGKNKGNLKVCGSYKY